MATKRSERISAKKDSKKTSSTSRKAAPPKKALKQTAPAPKQATKKSPPPKKAPPRKKVAKKSPPVKKAAGASPKSKCNLVEKIIYNHLIDGQVVQGAEITIKIDQTLTRDENGAMVYLQLEAMGIKRVRTELSVSYVDHNTLQTGFENSDDQRYLQTVAAKYGIYFSRPGNGIAHQVHLERFGAPGKTLLGGDARTSMVGALGSLAIGAGGLDVALAMCGQPLHLIMPRVVNVVLKGKLSRWVTAKDVILELLRRLTIRGGVQRIFEFSGDGLKNLSLTDRAVIANTGAELGAVSSIFPSDNITQAFLRQQKRPRAYRPLSADSNCRYDEQITLNLRKIEPLVAQPHSPDNVIEAKKLKNVKVDQVIIGADSNSSFDDFSLVAEILKNSCPAPDTSLSVVPGSKQVLQNLAKEGRLEQLLISGARILECACGPSAGLGHTPASNSVSLRTFNRNEYGRDAANKAQIYLCSPLTAAASALKGKITDPRTLKRTIKITPPKTFLINDSMIIKPPKSGARVQVVRGPNIKPLPINDTLSDDLQGVVLLHLGEDISTNQILPSGPHVQLQKSNIPAIAKHLFQHVDPDFTLRARQNDGGFIVAGENYGQGASHEHAALAAMYLGIKAVLAKSFARIHRANLINYGIIPMTFVDPANYDNINRGDKLEIPFVKHMLTQGKPLVIKNLTKHKDYNIEHGLTLRQCEVVLAGGLLNFIRQSR